MTIPSEIARAWRLGFSAYARYRRRRIANRLLRVLNLVGPRRLECPCCGWHGTRFLNHVRETYWMRAAVCPRCRSHPRHRGLALYLEQIVPRLVRRAAILHFAPERALTAAFARHPGVRYIAVDLGPRALSARADITAIPFRTGVFDLVIASHVLEHVAADRAALAEVVRVTAPGGRVLVMVPMLPGWQRRETVEFGYPNPAEDGHFRIYGRDTADRISAAGLRCESFALGSLFPPEQQLRYGLRDAPLFVGYKPA